MKIFISLALLLGLFSAGIYAQESETNLEDADEIGQGLEASRDLTQPLPGMDPSNSMPPADSLFNNSFMKGFVSEQMKKMLFEYMKKNPFASMSETEVEDFIMGNVKDRPAEQFFKKFPKALKALVNWLRDPKAIPAFLNIINKPKLLKNYGIAVLVVFILSFALNLMNSKGSLLKRIFNKLCIMLGAFAINFGMFYIFFKEEITPTIEVMMRTFFG